MRSSERAEYVGTLGQISSGAVGGERSLQGPDYERAADRYDVDVSGGVNGLTIEVG
jgi:hypothetical protein